MTTVLERWRENCEKAKDEGKAPAEVEGRFLEYLAGIDYVLAFQFPYTDPLLYLQHAAEVVGNRWSTTTASCAETPIYMGARVALLILREEIQKTMLPVEPVKTPELFEVCEWCGSFVNDGLGHGEDRCFSGETGEPLLERMRR
jgi:hypothetical protein